jgi:hypothetical protein
MAGLVGNLGNVGLIVGHLGHLEDRVAGVGNDLRADLHDLLPKREFDGSLTIFPSTLESAKIWAGHLGMEYRSPYFIKNVFDETIQRCKSWNSFPRNGPGFREASN